MKKKQKPSRVETIVEFLVERFKIPTRTEFENLIRKTEESLQRLKLPTMTEFNQLVKRVEELEKVAKVRKEVAKKVSRPVKPKKIAKKKTGAARVTDLDRVFKVVKEYPDGVNVGTLKAETGFEDKKVRNIVFRLGKQGKIERVGRGIYKPKE